jgi:hypothetical protein
VEQPDHLNDADAIRLVRKFATDSNNIVVIRHARKRQAQRLIVTGMSFHVRCGQRARA